MSAGIDADKAPGPRHVVAALCGIAVGVAVLVPAVRPTHLLDWLLIGGISIVAGVAVTAVVTWLLHLPARPWLRHRHRVVVLPVATALVTLVVVGAAAAVLRPEAAAAFCPHPTELRILTAPSRLTVASDLASGFQQFTSDNAGCPSINPYVYAAPDGNAAAALAAGWTVSNTADLGPRPDVWLPELPASVDQTNQELVPGESGLSHLDYDVVGFTPLVLAVAGLPDELTPHRSGLTWEELVTRARDADLELARPAPEVSEVGKLVVTALYRGGTLDARELEVHLSRHMQEHGYPLADVDALLCRHWQRSGEEGTAATGLLVTERAVVAYNRREPPTATCVEPQPETSPTPLLEGFYATDTLTVDYAVASLDWHQVYPRQREAAEEFRAWLSDQEGRSELVGVGLRIPGQPAAEQLPDEHGIVPGIGIEDPRNVAMPEAAQAHRRYTAARRPGRILFALDVSGSMKEEVRPDRIRIQVARDGIDAALVQQGADDEFGLWAFPDQSSRSPTIEIKDLGTEGLNEQQRQDLNGLLPNGPTPLYRTILDGIEAVGTDEAEADAAEQRVTAVVVLTDGEDSGRSTPPIDDLTEAADTGGVRIFVVAIGEASCGVDVVAEVTQLSGGECVYAEFDALDEQLTELFGRLWSGG